MKILDVFLPRDEASRRIALDLANSKGKTLLVKAAKILCGDAGFLSRALLDLGLL
jgi:hypothetical protein